MTDNKLEEIRKRCDAATPGPWFAGSKPDQFGDECIWLKNCNRDDIEDAQWLMNVNSHGDAQFIAASREDIPYLLGLVEQLTNEKSDKNAFELMRKWSDSAVMRKNSHLIEYNKRLERCVKKMKDQCASDQDFTQKQKEEIDRLRQENVVTKKALELVCEDKNIMDVGCNAQYWLDKVKQSNEVHPC